eukprot:TRINITY_DN1448_c0_g1_i2.p1 TRINITY_DN1448_c0_g1~~TRINITY_DN1448_c0_g1_i2.p1  ORF type:complete len:760 (-),score=69.57 TRINITY_DN1448_c0_g1_i2:154-2433(-)
MESTLDPFAFGPIPTLSRLCCQVFGRSISEAIFEELSRDQTEAQSSWEQTLEAVRPKVEELANLIPQQPFEDLVEYLLDKTTYAGMAVASLAADKLSSIRTRFLQTHKLSISVLATSLLTQSPANLVHLELFGLIVNDDFVWSLATSVNATILKTFACIAKSLSHKSNAAWPRFTALETLKLEEFNHPVTIEFADALSHLPRLETLRVQEGYWFPDWRSVIAALLAPHSLPCLRVVDMYCSQDLPSELCEHVYNLLLKRPTSHLLEVIEFCDDGPPEEIGRDLFVKMHTLCPNLKHPFPEPEEIISTPETAAMAKNFITFRGKRIDPEQTPKLFPHLESLSLYNQIALPPHFARWDIFISLRDLQIYKDSFTPILRFPPTLQKLQISSKLLSNADDANLDSFFEALCVQVPRLKDLKIHFHSNFITVQQAERVLNSLRELEDLSLVNGGYVSTEAITHRIELTHPCLHRVPKLSITGLQAVPVWLPGITQQTESNIVRYGIVSANIVRVLLETDNSLMQRQDLFDRLAKKCRVAAIDARSWAALSSISLPKTLTSLRIQTYSKPVPDDVIAALVSQLPMLSDLRVALRSVGQHASCRWLHHPRLSHLHLYFWDGVDLDEISFTRESLPMLCSAEVQCQRLQIFTFVVDELPLLETLRIDSPGEQTDLSVRNCPALQLLELRRICLGELYLCDLPGLRELIVSATWVPDVTCIVRVDLPQLIRASCLLNEPEDLWRTEFINKLKMRDDASGGHRFSLQFQ